MVSYIMSPPDLPSSQYVTVVLSQIMEGQWEKLFSIVDQCNFHIYVYCTVIESCSLLAPAACPSVRFCITNSPLYK